MFETQKLRRMRFRSKVLRLPLNWYRYRGICPEDVLLASYPRSGSTWLRFLLFEVLAGEPADFMLVRTSMPYIGAHAAARRVLPGGGRIIQTHETYCNSATKVVSVVRDPRNVVVSQYHHFKRLRSFAVGTWDDFFEDWLAGKAVPFGAWDQHVKFWLRSKPAKTGRLHLLRYEDLRTDPQSALGKLLEFLDVIADKEAIAHAVANNSLERMRDKEDRNRTKPQRDPDKRFVRSGSISGYEQDLTAEQQARILHRFGETLRELGYTSG